MDLSTLLTLTLASPLVIGGVVRQKPSLWPAWHRFQVSRGESHTKSPLARRLVGLADFILASAMVYRPTRVVGASLVGVFTLFGVAKRVHDTGLGLASAKEEVVLALMAGGVLWAETR